MHESDPLYVSLRGLHESPWRLVAICTGAGTGLADLLWQVPGSSNTILEMLVPYSRHALADLIGRQPAKFVSAETARQMAAAAYSRAQELAVRDGQPPDRLVGLGLTAGVATGRPKKGRRRANLALRTARHCQEIELDFIGRTEDRAAEGSDCDQMALDMILDAAGIPHAGRLRPSAPLTETGSGVPPLFLDGKRFRAPGTGLVIWPEGWHGRWERLASLSPDRHVIFPGSFNPLHYGHEQVAAAAERLTGKRVVFALTADHPVKGPLSDEELCRRARQFAWRHPVLVTAGDGLYVDKCRRFPGFDIVIGADALLGLLDNRHYVERYRDRIANLANEQDRTVYGQNQHWMALHDIRKLESRFLVSGRVTNGNYLDPIEIINDKVYWPFRELFVPISGGADISSSALRARSR